MNLKEILPEDFDKATNTPWSTTTCLIAQAARRQTGKDVKFCGHSVITLADDEKIPITGSMLKLLSKFDNAYSNANDRDYKTLAEIRAQLPLKLSVDNNPCLIAI